MKKHLHLWVVMACFLFVSFLTPQKAYADMDPKVKAITTMAAYGTVGGALLGTASLAFGAKGRSVAIGASLGLYAGILFGTYIIVTHSMGQKGYYDQPQPVRQENYYPDDGYSPYQPGYDGAGGAYDGGFNRIQSFQELEMTTLEQRRSLDHIISNGAERPVFEVQLFNYNF